jgi:hypothetical protein
MREVIQSHPEICSELLGGAKFLATLDPFMSKWTDSKVVFSAVHCTPLPILYIPNFFESAGRQVKERSKGSEYHQWHCGQMHPESCLPSLGQRWPCQFSRRFLGHHLRGLLCQN